MSNAPFQAQSNDLQKLEPKGNAPHRAAYHAHPNGHYVLSESMWEHFQASQPEKTKAGSLVAGEIGSLLAVPVYIDECPWQCGVRSE